MRNVLNARTFCSLGNYCQYYWGVGNKWSTLSTYSLVEWRRWGKKLDATDKMNRLGFVHQRRLFFSKGLSFVFCDPKIIFGIAHKIDCSKLVHKAVWFCVIVALGFLAHAVETEETHGLMAQINWIKAKSSKARSAKPEDLQVKTIGYLWLTLFCCAPASSPVLGTE